MHKIESVNKWKKITKNTHLLVLKQGGDFVLDHCIRVSYACFYCPGPLADLRPLLTPHPPFSHEWIHITNDRHEFPKVSGSEYYLSSFTLGLDSNKHIQRGSVSTRHFIVVIDPRSCSVELEKLRDWEIWGKVIAAAV